MCSWFRVIRVLNPRRWPLSHLAQPRLFKLTASEPESRLWCWSMYHLGSGPSGCDGCHWRGQVAGRKALVTVSRAAWGSRSRGEYKPRDNRSIQWIQQIDTIKASTWTRWCSSGRSVSTVSVNNLNRTWLQLACWLGPAGYRDRDSDSRLDSESG